MKMLADPDFGRIYRVTRANFEHRARDEAAVHELLPAGHLAGRRPADASGPASATSSRSSSAHLGSDFEWDGNWAPRIGATYDVIGNGRSKLYANWGRFFAKIPNDLAARALSADAGVTRADYFDAALTQPIPDGVPAGPAHDTIISFAGLHAGGLRSGVEVDLPGRDARRVRVRAVSRT